MADELGPAVTALQRKLDEQIQAVTDTKRTINMLLKMSGQDPLYPASEEERSGAVRADQFYGRGLATSAAEYLAMRKQACQGDEILRGLESGGFDFDILGWKEDDRLRNLAISLAKNTGSAGKFHRLKNGSFGLRSWYDEDFLKKTAAGAEATAKAKKRASIKAANENGIQPVKKKRGRPPKVRPAADQVAATGPAIEPVKKSGGAPEKLTARKTQNFYQNGRAVQR